MSTTPSDPSDSAPEAWTKCLTAETATLADAIRSLNDSGLQIVLVVSPQGRLTGTVTDGDIRRGLMRGLTLESPIDAVLQREPLVVPPQIGRETVLQLMRANRLHQVPIVEADRHVVGLHLWDEVISPGRRPNLMVIMAGGEGTRLRPHTASCPKPLLPVSGKPILEHIIERARAEGFNHFVLAIRYLGHMIEQHFGDGRRWDVEINYVREEQPLGTAGALALLTPRPDAPFVVSNGDVLTDIRYGEVLDFHAGHRAAATMAVRLYEWQHPFGVVHTEGVDIIDFEEKPVARSYVNAGVYVLDPAALDELRPGERRDMPALFAGLQRRAARTIVYPMHEPWLDIGRTEDYTSARAGGRD